MSLVGELADYLQTAGHLFYLLSVECASAIMHLPYSYAGSEFVLLSWVAYGIFVALDYFSKPLNIFNLYAKKGIFKVVAAVLATMYLYLAYLLLLFSVDEGISWTSNFKELSDSVAVSNLFWFFWILKLANVYLRRLLGDDKSRKGVLLLAFWFLNLKYEELAQAQLAILIIVDCVRSASLLLVVDSVGFEKHGIWVTWLFETVDSFIFLTAYTFASRYPMFAFINMAVFNPYSMIIIVFLGMFVIYADIFTSHCLGSWSLYPVFIAFALRSLHKKYVKSNRTPRVSLQVPSLSSV
jgi:hypothetical protein